MKWLHRRVWYRFRSLDLGLNPATGTNFCGGSPNWCVVEACIKATVLLMAYYQILWHAPDPDDSDKIFNKGQATDKGCIRLCVCSLIT